MKKFGLILLAFNRPKHTARVLEGLRREGLNEFSIYLDGPRHSEDEARQAELLGMFNGIDWAEVRVVRRQFNLGLANSIERAVRDELESSEFVAVLEDDCVPRRGFLQFMTTAAAKYRDNPAVRSVCAYQYPMVERAGPFLTDIAMYRFNPWGWGTWSDRWADYRHDLRSLVKRAKVKGCFASLGEDLREYCEMPQFLEGKADIWSINWILTHYLSDTFAVFPSRCIIDNIGFDGTGVHSIATEVFTSRGEGMQDALSLQLSDHPRPDLELCRLVDEFLRNHSSKSMHKRTAVA